MLIAYFAASAFASGGPEAVPQDVPQDEVGEPNGYDASAETGADASVSAQPWEETALRAGALPAVSYNSDEGIGAGGLATIYRYDSQTAPYKWRLAWQIFLTTKGVHAHYLELSDQARG